MHKGARTDPCGGRGVTRAPTATKLMRASGFRITESRFGKAIFECFEENPDADRV